MLVEVEEVELLPEASVVALFCLLDPLEIGVQIRL